MSSEKKKPQKFNWKKKLSQIRELMDVLRGKVDVREKLSWLFSPSNLKTASFLSIPQAEFVEDAFLVTKYFPQFQPLKDLALEVLEVSCSIKGKRMEDAINSLKATGGGKGTQIGIFGEMKEKVKQKIEED